MSTRPRQPIDIRTDAARLLRRRPLSVNELTERLLQRGHEATAITTLLTELRSLGLADDDRLATALAESQITSHAATPHILSKLAERGIPTDVACSATSAAAHASNQTDHDRATELVSSRLRGPLANLPWQTRHRRLAALLARRGHHEDTIEAVLSELCPQPNLPLSSHE